MTLVIGDTGNGSESAISSSTRTAISSTSVTVVAHLVYIYATCGSIARIYRTFYTIITVHFSVFAVTSDTVARVVGTFAAIVAHFVGVVASLHVIARVNSARNSIVAGNGSVDTFSSNASIVCAYTAIIALHLGVDTAFHLVASINGTWVLIITRDRIELAPSSGKVAGVFGTSRIIIATDGGIGDTLRVGRVANVRIALVTLARAIDFHRGSTLGTIRNGGILA